MQNDIRINNWMELQEALFSNTWDENLQRHRSSYVYRGLSDASYKLHTSLSRLGGNYPQLEQHLLRNFKKYAHKDADQGSLLWNWLALAQHHGLPTRMIDWTYSPYVALHYATTDLEKYNKDGVIWCINYVETSKYLPQRLKEIINDEGSNVFTAEMLQLGARSFKELDTMQKEDFLLFLEPPSLDQRIVNQYALFSLISNNKALLDKWLQNHPTIYFRIIIPAELKWEIRDKLDQANITERVLLPGLDGLSRWLKRHYSPRK